MSDPTPERPDGCAQEAAPPISHLPISLPEADDVAGDPDQYLWGV